MVGDMHQTTADPLPILRDLLKRGLLVPVLGAGMSKNPDGSGGRDWKTFVHQLEIKSGVEPIPNDDDYALRAGRAVRLLRSADPTGIQVFGVIKESTGTASATTIGTRQLRELVKHRWPLVITMNYDGWYEASFTERWKDELSDVTTKGRVPEDCWSVVRSLGTIKSPLCWAIHGCFERPNELVITSSDYRTALHDEPHFRKAISTVIRQRALLFLGASMNDPHLNDVLDEDAHHLGGTTLARFAVFIGNNLTEAQEIFLRTERGIIPIQVSTADELSTWLSLLCTTDQDMRRGGADGITYEQVFSPEGTSVEITLSNRPITLPDISAQPTHLWGLSAGISGTRWHGAEWVSRIGISIPTTPVPKDGINQSPSHANVWFVQSQRNSSDGTWRRDLRAIGDHLVHLLDMAVQMGVPVLHLNLIGGGEGRDDPGPWYLIAMLQAIRLRFPSGSTSKLRIDIHLIDRDVLFELLGGRLSPSMILAGPPWPVWIDASPIHEPRQRATLTGTGTAVHNLIAQAGFPPDKVHIDIEPQPSTDISIIDKQTTVAAAGILPGATLKLKHV